MNILKLTAKSFHLLIKRRLNINSPSYIFRYLESNYNKPILGRLSLITQSYVLRKYIHYSSNVNVQQTHSLGKESLNDREYEHISDETLESLTERLEELIEEADAPPDSDITYSSGVLTLKLGSHGTYVINKQTPNMQIWLSSPFSGPKRYDFQNNDWVYRHDGTSLHSLLSRELSLIFKKKIDLVKDCVYSGRDS